MATILLSIIIVCLAIAGIGVGMMFGRAPIKGSCGGLACAEGAECACGKKGGTA